MASFGFRNTGRANTPGITVLQGGEIQNVLHKLRNLYTSGRLDVLKSENGSLRAYCGQPVVT